MGFEAIQHDDESVRVSASKCEEEGVEEFMPRVIENVFVTVF
jgi:hypothetical protein